MDKKIRFTLPTKTAQWTEETPSDSGRSSASYSRCWTLRLVAAVEGNDVLIGWVDLWKMPKDKTRPYRWSMFAPFDREEPSGWVGTLEEAAALIEGRLGIVEVLP